MVQLGEIEEFKYEGKLITDNLPGRWTRLSSVAAKGQALPRATDSWSSERTMQAECLCALLLNIIICLKIISLKADGTQLVCHCLKAKLAWALPSEWHMRTFDRFSHAWALPAAHTNASYDILLHERPHIKNQHSLRDQVPNNRLTDYPLCGVIVCIFHLASHP